MRACALTPEVANEVYDALMEHAGATEFWREDFVHHQTKDDPTHEYRFQGDLAFGGKFYRLPWANGSEEWFVSCYPEDLTDKRRQMIERTNAVVQRIAKRIFQEAQ